MTIITHPKTLELIEFLEPIPVSKGEAVILAREEKLAQLANERVGVEERGIPQEYLDLADEYAKLGAIANAEKLRAKAAAMTGRASTLIAQNGRKLNIVGKKQFRCKAGSVDLYEVEE